MTTVYRLTELHTAKRGGMNAAVDASIRGVAKTNDECEFTIANEVLAAQLGRTLGLPIPSGVIAEDDKKKRYYLSLDVSREQKTLPPIQADDFAREEPWLAAGVAVFDVFIANGDRHTGNLSRDEAFTPPRVSVFDHGHALLGTSPPIGEDRLTEAEDRLGCVDDKKTPALAGNTCCLFGENLDARHIEAWIARIEALPDYVIDDACSDLVGVDRLGVSRELADKLAEWLKRRRGKLSDLIRTNEHMFPKVQWTLPDAGGTTDEL